MTKALWKDDDREEKKDDKTSNSFYLQGYRLWGIVFFILAIGMVMIVFVTKENKKARRFGDDGNPLPPSHAIKCGALTIYVGSTCVLYLVWSGSLLDLDVFFLEPPQQDQALAFSLNMDLAYSSEDYVKSINYYYTYKRVTTDKSVLATAEMKSLGVSRLGNWKSFLASTERTDDDGWLSDEAFESLLFGLEDARVFWHFRSEYTNPTEDDGAMTPNPPNKKNVICGPLKVLRVLPGRSDLDLLHSKLRWSQCITWLMLI
ncbi:hypothetical protein DM860_011833 [Cuscuta australis]|uniref:Uncharacterized protein n=1 Tax=Cuscuta australis TaxID=267555 RepID=A0A328DA57_9ASTE|nr:hypothetical protein DM860_011833 [Cuscuta australis]